MLLSSGSVQHLCLCDHPELVSLFCQVEGISVVVGGRLRLQHVVANFKMLQRIIFVKCFGCVTILFYFQDYHSTI